MKRLTLITVLLVVGLLYLMPDAAAHHKCGHKGRVCPPTSTTSTTTRVTTSTTSTTSTSTTTTTTRPTSTYFATLPPGSSLPSGETCAGLVKDAAETRSMNIPYNSYIPVRGTDFYDPQWGPNFGMDSRASAFSARIDGNFTGTTDEIIQWGACKWGFDEDIARAVAVTESWWDQRTNGDNGESWGLMQVRPPYHPGTYPAARLSTAYNVDYTLAYRRACYEGWLDWLHDYTSVPYTAGDEWGCVGHWFSGRWNDDAGGQNYIRTVQGHLANRTWQHPDFLGYR